MNVSKIPLELRECGQWVCWKSITRGDDKPTKVPFMPNGSSASTTNQDTWSRFEDAYANAGTFSGVGFVFTADDDFCGVDLDGCRDPETGEVAEWAREIIRACDSYSEISPSESGVKIFCRCNAPGGGKKFPVDAMPMGGKSPAIEIYDRGRYFAVTGKRVSGVFTGIRDCQAAIDSIVSKYAKTETPSVVYNAADYYSTSSVVDRAIAYVEKMPESVSGQGGHNALFKVACKVVCGFGLDGGDAMHVLQVFNQRCQPPWSERELQHKISQATKTPGERNYLRNIPLERQSQVSVPEYEMPKDEQPSRKHTTLTTAAEKYVEYLLSDQGKLISTGIQSLDESLGGGVDFGEVVVIAGRPSHGKSAVALQMIHEWTGDGIPCLFVSEEMSERQLGKRLLQYICEYPEDQWKTNTKSLRKDVKYYHEDREECYIVESCGNVETVISEIESHVKDCGVKAVLVDYAQLLDAKGRDQREKVANVSKSLSKVARRLGIVLVLLAQISRDIEKRPKFTPIMGDLKESGQIEQDADIIIFGVWPHRINSECPASDYQLYIAKNRNRGVSRPVLKVRFNALRQMLVDESESQRVPYSEHFSEFDGLGG